MKKDVTSLSLRTSERRTFKPTLIPSLVRLTKPAVLFLCILWLSACGTTNVNDINKIKSNHESPKVTTPLPPPEVEVQKDDFIYKLYTEKDVYDEYQDTAIIAELTYVGEGIIDIGHGDPLLSFSLEERTRNVKIDMLIREIGMTTRLKHGETITKRYDMTKGHVFEDDKASMEFFNTVKRKGLPAGEYIVHGRADIYFADERRYSLSGEIGFTVVKR